MDKSVIRKASLARRDALTKNEIEEKSRLIFERLVELQSYKDAENILVYVSMRSEVMTRDIILDALANAKKVFCPKVTDKANGIMDFVRISSLEDLKEGCFGISEPDIGEDSELFDPHDLGKTLMIMPGAAFDRENNRIGYGGGFYDRFLRTDASYETIALAFECQIIDELIEADEFDVKPTVLLTEEREFIR